MSIHIGQYNRLKKLSTLQHKCCLCGQTSECTIESWRSYGYLNFIPIWLVGKGYLFTWSSCNHSMGLDDPLAVKQYKEEQVDTGVLSVPLCEKLKPMSIERQMPINIKNVILLSPFILIILVGIVYICLAISGFR